MKKKIGLAGKSGSGKNVIADLMCSKYEYKQIAVADAIRDECSGFIRAALDRGWYFPDSFELVIQSFLDAIWAKPTPPEIRVLLQWWGSELRRAQDPDYWIKKLAIRLDNDDPIVVSDVRLPDEMETIRAAGGEVWLVERDGVDNVGIVGHRTEHGLDGAQFDRVIQNNGTLAELETMIDQIVLYRSTS